jgi:hypothetical protein
VALEGQLRLGWRAQKNAQGVAFWGVFGSHFIQSFYLRDPNRCELVLTCKTPAYDEKLGTEKKQPLI